MMAELAPILPFSKTPNNLMGLVMKSMLLRGGLKKPREDGPPTLKDEFPFFEDW